MQSLTLYENVVGCPVHCSGIVRNDHTEIPRGFYTEAEPGDEIVLLVVAQNPGQAMRNQGESRLYLGLPPLAAARRHMEFVRSCFYGNAGKLFHRRLLDWLSDLLDVPRSEVFRHVVYTNAVKCSTERNKRPRKVLADTCIVRHLKSEIAYWNPRYVVGLGGATQEYLEWNGIGHVCLPHPSHRGKSDFHRLQLEQLRQRLLLEQDKCHRAS